MFDESYTTPEGFWLPRRLLLPDARSFADVLEYLGEWDHETMSHHSGTIPRPDLVPAPRRIGDNEIGPYCTIGLGQIGGKQHRSIAVRATDIVIDAVTPHILTPDDHLSFDLIAHKSTERVLVILHHSYIIGSHWIAYIDATTIPPYPYESRDERYREICEAIREDGKSPYVKRLPGGDIRISATTRDIHGAQREIVATVHVDGSITRVWADGTENREPAR